MALGFFSSEDTLTPASIDRRRKMAEMLLDQSTSTAPVAHWTQGAARLLGGIAGKYEDSKLDTAEKGNQAYTAGLVKQLLGGGDAPASAAPVIGSAPASSGAPIAAGPARAPSGSQSEFVASLMPHAMKVSQETGLDPRLVIAQSALETGWGKSAPGNNFFGIKSHGVPGGNTMPTTEVINGQSVRMNDSFRAYSGMGESAADYAAFLKKNPRYGEMLKAQGLDAQVDALSRSGYATDPNYGQKISSIARGIPMPQEQGQPVQMASAGGMTPDGMPTSPVPSNAAPMSFAPGQQAAPAPSPQTPAQAPQPMAAPAGKNNRMAALAAFLSDPRVDRGTKASLGPLLAAQLQPKSPMVIPEGGQLYDPTTRQFIGSGSPKQTNDQREYQFAKGQGFAGSFMDYQTALKKAGASSTNVSVGAGESEFDKKIAGKQADFFSGAAEDAVTAKADAGRIAQLRGNIEALPGGFLGGAQALASQYGIPVPGKSNVEAAKAIINQLVPAQRVPGSGTTSDRDLALFQASLPQLSNSREGNKIILDTMEGMAKYKQAQGDIATQVMTGAMSRSDGLKAIQSLPDPFEGLKKAIPTAGAKAAVPASSASDPLGIR